MTTTVTVTHIVDDINGSIPQIAVAMRAHDLSDWSIVYPWKGIEHEPHCSPYSVDQTIRRKLADVFGKSRYPIKTEFNNDEKPPSTKKLPYKDN